MDNFYAELVVNNDKSAVTGNTDNGFIISTTFWDSDKLSSEQLYQQIVFAVLRKPRQLILHIQRIYFTYSNKQAEQLYAAIIDLLWILDSKGESLCKRMITASSSVLSEIHNKRLSDYLATKDRAILLGNKFSIFLAGEVGTGKLLTEQKEEESLEHDPLLIALDFIEYSQLDNAIKTLETGIINDLERIELQTELLQLYKVTKDRQAFLDMHQVLLTQEIELSADWQVLMDYFKDTDHAE